MEDIKSWESKFQPCEYSDKLLNLITELNKTVRIPVDVLEIKKACYYAREYHGSQLRKSGDPYYSHPLEVAYLFAKYVAENAQQHYTTDLIIIAILHDTIEDTKLTYEIISIIFNKIIAEGVQDLSRIIIGDSKTTAGDTLLSLYPQNKHDLLYVKIFDRLHNTRTLGAKSLDKRWKTIRENTVFFISLTKKLNMREIADELERLAHPTIPLDKVAFKEYRLPNLFA